METLELTYNNLSQLTYKDFSSIEIQLFMDGSFVDFMEVYTDTDMEGREYISINYEVIYLDDLKIKTNEI